MLENTLSSHPGVEIGQNLSLEDLDYAGDVRILLDPEKATNMLHNLVTWADRIGLKRQSLWQKVTLILFR